MADLLEALAHLFDPLFTALLRGDSRSRKLAVLAWSLLAVLILAVIAVVAAGLRTSQV